MNAAVQWPGLKQHCAYSARIAFQILFNLQATCVLYIGHAFRYSPEKDFNIFNQQIYFII